jgi:hypothetical protein
MYFVPARTGLIVQAQSTARITHVVLIKIILDLDKVNIPSILEVKDIRIFVVFVNATTISESDQINQWTIFHQTIFIDG